MVIINTGNNLILSNVALSSLLQISPSKNKKCELEISQFCKYSYRDYAGLKNGLQSIIIIIKISHDENFRQHKSLGYSPCRFCVCNFYAKTLLSNFEKVVEKTIWIKECISFMFSLFQRFYHTSFKTRVIVLNIDVLRNDSIIHGCNWTRIEFHMKFSYDWYLLLQKLFLD